MNSNIFQIVRFLFAPKVVLRRILCTLISNWKIFLNIACKLLAKISCKLGSFVAVIRRNAVSTHYRNVEKKFRISFNSTVRDFKSFFWGGGFENAYVINREG